MKMNVPRSVIPACDVPWEKFQEIVEKTKDVPKIGGYKVGFKLMLEQGLQELDIPKNTVYNHCSASTDIPPVGAKMMEALKTRPEITGVILTPLSGPVTQEAWIKAAKEKGLKVYLEPALDIPDFFKSGGGYIEDDAVGKMMDIAMKLGVDGFILPENELGYDLANVVESVYFRNGNRIVGLNELKAFEVMAKGLPKVVEVAKGSGKPVIYDHQKAATSFPEYAEQFANVCKDAGVDYVIFFPMAGPTAQDAYTKAARDQGLEVIIGGLMTHPGYPASEGGYISEEAGLSIYQRAAKAGIKNDVVPGNRIETVKKIIEVAEEEDVEIAAWAPGLVAQGGVLNEVAQLFKEFNGIVGRGIYQAEDIEEAGYTLTSKL